MIKQIIKKEQITTNDNKTTQRDKNITDKWFYNKFNRKQIGKNTHLFDKAYSVSSDSYEENEYSKTSKACDFEK